MNENASEVVADRIALLVETLLPHGGGGTLTEVRLRWALDQVAQVAYAEGVADGLRRLRTADDAAEAWGVTPSRARAHIARLHKRWSVGSKIGGVWLLTQAEIEQHVPDAHAPRPRLD